MEMSQTPESTCLNRIGYISEYIRMAHRTVIIVDLFLGRRGPSKPLETDFSVFLQVSEGHV